MAEEQYSTLRNAETLSQWKVLTEKHVVEALKNPDGSSLVVDVPYLGRGDGFTVKMTDTKGGAEYNVEEFTCTGTFGSFTFEACRWDSSNETPLPVYQVDIYDYVDAHDRLLAFRHAKDIESALIHFPVRALYKGLPVQAVIFRVGTTQHPKDLSADEVMHYA